MALVQKDINDAITTMLSEMQTSTNPSVDFAAKLSKIIYDTILTANVKTGITVVNGKTTTTGIIE